MNDDKVKLFMELAGQKTAQRLHAGTPAQRALGAQLLLSEVLEYVIKGLGVIPEFHGTAITDANTLAYRISDKNADLCEMVDGLADTAYTMFWNSLAFGAPIENAFDMVCDNNLQKFVRLSDWTSGEGEVSQSDWALGLGVTWPKEVVAVHVVRTSAGYFAVGKDVNGKVRKPSSYAPVDLQPLVKQAANG